MKLIPTPTILEQGALKGAEAIHHAVTVLSEQWRAVWNRNPATVAAELNADPVMSAQLMALHNQAANALNALLDAVNDQRYSNRAQTSMPNGWTFADGVFSYSPPATPVVEEEQ